MVTPRLLQAFWLISRVLEEWILTILLPLDAPGDMEGNIEGNIGCLKLGFCVSVSLSLTGMILLLYTRNVLWA